MLTNFQETRTAAPANSGSILFLVERNSFNNLRRVLVPDQIVVDQIVAAAAPPPQCYDFYLPCARRHAHGISKTATNSAFVRAANR